MQAKAKQTKQTQAPSWYQSKLALGYAFWKLQAKTVKIEHKHWRKTC